MDCILGYHLNPYTCGIARFNRALGDRLEVPVHSMFSAEGAAAHRPLLSFSASEMSAVDLDRLGALAGDAAIWPRLRLFFHNYSATEVEAALIRRSEKLYCGNEALKRELEPHRDDVIQAWCPGHLFERREFDLNSEIRIYTFGMAHKLRADYYRLLHGFLEKTRRSYVIYVSAAVHEGTSLDDSFTGAYDELRTIFGERVFFLGFISDAAVYALLKTCTMFAAFFQNGVRANNTSVNTAMQSGVPVLTNLDDGSPRDFVHLESVIDIKQCIDELPHEKALLDRIAAGGKVVSERLGWPPLLNLFRRSEPELQPAGKPRDASDTSG